MVRSKARGYFRSTPLHFGTPWFDLFASHLDLFTPRFHLFARHLSLFASRFRFFARRLDLFARHLSLFASRFRRFARRLSLFASNFRLYSRSLALFSLTLHLIAPRLRQPCPPIKKPDPKARLNKKRCNQRTRLSYSGEESLPFRDFRSNRLRRSS